MTRATSDPERFVRFSGAFWVKIVEFLQQNWAVIESEEDGANVYFVTDLSEIFDEMAFGDQFEAATALTRNGFELFGDDPEHRRFLRIPEPPYVWGEHPNGRIYSSGRFWR